MILRIDYATGRIHHYNINTIDFENNKLKFTNEGVPYAVPMENIYKYKITET